MEKVNGGIGAYGDGKGINYVFTDDHEFNGWRCPMCDEMMIDYDEQFCELERIGMVDSGGTTCLRSGSHKCPFLHSITVLPHHINGEENYVDALINCSVREYDVGEVREIIGKFIVESYN